MMKKLFLTLIAALLFASGFLSHSILVSMAGEETQYTKYYKSVQIQDGDNLWTLARQYKGGGPLSEKEYVQELKQINGLKEDTIHCGQYLTVVYFRDASGSLY